MDELSDMAGGAPTSAEILQQLEQAIQRCVAEQGSPSELADLHFRSAQLFLAEDCVAVAPSALEHLWEAWKLEPEDVQLRLTLASCLERAGKLAQLAELHQRAAELLDDSRERTALLLAAGKACERLGDLDEALQMLRQAAELGEHRQRQQRIEALGALADRLRAAGLLAQEAEARRLLLGELFGNDRLPCALELAALRQRLGDPAGAYAAQAEALAVIPTAAAALEPALAYLKSQDQAEEAARLMESAALGDPAGAARAARWRALAEHCEVLLGDASRAIRCWWRAWEEEESGREAPNLKRLSSEQEDWRGYQRVLEREIRLARTPGAKIDSYRELATFQREVLEDKLAAAASCSLILQLDPADAEALALRVQLCEEQGLQQQLIEALRRQVRYQRPCPEREAAAARLARLEADAGHTSNLLGVLDQLDPLAASTRELVRELQERAWEQRERALALKLGMLALKLAGQAEEPTEQRISQALRLADQCREAGEFGEAADCYRRVLELSGDHREARARLEELTQREQLLDPTAISLALRAERLAEEHPGRACSLLIRAAHVGLQAEPPAREAAAKYLRRALSLRQAGAALELPVLEEALAAAEMYEELAVLLEQEAAAADQLVLRKTLLQYLAEVCRDKLHQPERAVLALQQVLPLDPADSEAMAQLRRLYESMGDFRAVAQVLEEQLDTADASAQLPLLEELAALYAGRLDDEAPAARHYHELLALQPNHRPALDFCRRHDEAAGNFRAVAVQLCRAAEAADDALERAQLHREIAQIAEERLSDLDFAINQWRQVVELCPADSAPRAELRRLLVQAERWPELESALLSEVSRSLRTEEKVPIYLQLADVAEEQLQQAQAAAGYLRMAQQLAPQDAEILRRLETLYEQLGSWHELASALRRHAEIVEAHGERVELLLRAAQVTLSRLRREEEALAICRYLREQAPGHRASAALMAEIYERRRQWREQAGLLREQISAELDPLEQARLHLDLGRLQLQRLNDPESAASHFEQALALDAGRGDALSLLRKLYESLGRWDLLVELIRRRTAAESVSIPEKVAALYEMGRIREEHQDDLAGAREAYERAVHLDGGFRPALTALRALALAKGQWREVVSLARQELQALSEPAEKSQLLLEIGRLLSEKMERPSAAIEALEEALSLDPGNTRAAELLAMIYFNDEEWERAGAFLQKVVDDRLELQNLHEYHYRLGFANEQLNQQDEAFSWYVKSFGQEPMYLPTLNRLVDLCYLRRQWDNTLRIAEAILGSYESQKSSQELAELSLRIGLCELHLAQQEVAVARIHGLLVEPGQQLLSPKEGLLDVAESWSATPLERTLLRGVRPEVIGRVVKAMERALIYAPELPRALEVLAALAGTVGDYERALRYLERAVEGTAGQRRRQAELLVFAGDIAAQRLRAAPRAEAYYRAAQRLSPGFSLAAERLDSLQATPPRGISTPPPYRGPTSLRGEITSGSSLAPSPRAAADGDSTQEMPPLSNPGERPRSPGRQPARDRDSAITQPLPPLPPKPRKP